jgi:hypothetical protein
LGTTMTTGLTGPAGWRERPAGLAAAVKWARVVWVVAPFQTVLVVDSWLGVVGDT